MSEFPNLKKPYDFIASLGGIGLIPCTWDIRKYFAWLVFVIMSHFVNMLIYTIGIVFIAIWVCSTRLLSI